MRLGTGRPPVVSPRTGAKTKIAGSGGSPDEDHAASPAETSAVEFLISRLVSRSFGAFVNRCSFILVVGLLSGCAHFESRPLSPTQAAADLESRTLNDPGLRSFLEKNLHRDSAAGPARA